MPKVVVLGGGYSGLACLIELSKKARDFDLHLVDNSTEHCKITNLHKTFRHPVDKFTISFLQLAEQYDFSFHRSHLSFCQDDLPRWQKEKKLELAAGAELAFDWLVIATGAAPIPLAAGSNLINQHDLLAGAGNAMLENLVGSWDEDPVQISLVGGGATGVQVLFELHQEMQRKRVPSKIRLVDLETQLVPDLPEGVHSYISRRMRRRRIEYLPGTNYLGQDEQSIELEDAATGRTYHLPSDRTLLFPGVAPAPFTLETNGYGQVVVNEQELPDIFSAGDCSSFNSSGLNSLTAQAALRKGRLVARNILNLCRERRLQTYRYQEKGYIISLGATDAIGWIGLRCNLVKGLPAIVIKEAMETQYDLFLDGVDTYLDFP